MRISCFLLRAFLVIAFVSCNPASPRKKDLIPEKLMVPLLVDMHIVNSMISVSNMRMYYLGIDTSGLFDPVFSKYHTNRKNFDLTIAYYSKRPDRLEKIYNKVLLELNRMDTEMRMLPPDEIPDAAYENLWKQKRTWRLPDDGPRNTIDFEIPVSGPGNYLIRVKLLVYPADQSVNPRLTAYFWYENDSPEGFRDYFVETKYPMAKVPRYFTAQKELTDTLVTHLKGSIVNHDSLDGEWSKNLVIEDIQIRHQPPSAEPKLKSDKLITSE